MNFEKQVQDFKSSTCAYCDVDDAGHDKFCIDNQCEIGAFLRLVEALGSGTKAVIALNYVPEYCYECGFCMTESFSGKIVCAAKGIIAHTEIENPHYKLDWCPIKEIK